ncbi:MAG TPA: hypothetical protein VF188_16025 [Longimicrobiales bacterium]
MAVKALIRAIDVPSRGYTAARLEVTTAGIGCHAAPEIGEG